MSTQPHPRPHREIWSQRSRSDLDSSPTSSPTRHHLKHPGLFADPSQTPCHPRPYPPDFRPELTPSTIHGFQALTTSTPTASRRPLQGMEVPFPCRLTTSKSAGATLTHRDYLVGGDALASLHAPDADSETDDHESSLPRSPTRMPSNPIKTPLAHSLQDHYLLVRSLSSSDAPHTLCSGGSSMGDGFAGFAGEPDQVYVDPLLEEESRLTPSCAALDDVDMNEGVFLMDKVQAGTYLCENDDPSLSGLDPPPHQPSIRRSSDGVLADIPVNTMSEYLHLMDEYYAVEDSCLQRSDANCHLLSCAGDSVEPSSSPSLPCGNHPTREGRLSGSIGGRPGTNQLDPVLTIHHESSDDHELPNQSGNEKRRRTSGTPDIFRLAPAPAGGAAAASSTGFAAFQVAVEARGSHGPVQTIHTMAAHTRSGRIGGVNLFGAQPNVGGNNAVAMVTPIISKGSQGSVAGRTPIGHRPIKIPSKTPQISRALEIPAPSQPPFEVLPNRAVPKIQRATSRTLFAKAPIDSNPHSTGPINFAPGSRASGSAGVSDAAAAARRDCLGSDSLAK